MLDKNKYLVKQHAKFLSSRKSYDILDADTGETVATVQQQTALMAKLLGAVFAPPATTLEVRAKAGGGLLFAVRRRGLLSKKVEAVDATGKVVGLYKAKRFSLKGGFHVYDGSGKHVAEIRGKLLKAEYQFYTPDGKTQMGSVSKKWAGSVKAALTSADTYGVEISPDFADEKTRIMILGAALAASALFGDGKATGGAKEDDDE